VGLAGLLSHPAAIGFISDASRVGVPELGRRYTLSGVVFLGDGVWGVSACFCCVTRGSWDAFGRNWSLTVGLVVWKTASFGSQPTGPWGLTPLCVLK
jgi:hypothetical protein